MKRVLGLLAAAVALLVPALSGSASPAVAVATSGETERPPSNVLYIPIPEGWTAGPDERAELIHKTISERARAAPRLPSRVGGSSEGALDLIVIFTDHGKPVLPDLEGAGALFGAATNQLTFTFNSPNRPWTPDEIASMEGYIADVYPVIEAVYGPPAFHNTVNVRKDVTADGGYYFASINEIVVPSPGGSLGHEMIHAFHDDAIMLSVFEEGMTRAAQIAVFNELDAWEYYGEHHKDEMFDVYYDLLNTPEAATLGGWVYRGMFFYQIGGYAWAKPYLENPAFFGRFNQAFYSEVAADPSTRWDAAKILLIAGSVQPTVEGKGFATWCREQYVLRTDAPVGYCLGAFDVDERGGRFFYFRRNASGGEEGMPGVPLDWTIHDGAGRLMSRGSAPTDEHGTMGLMLNDTEVPPDYTGRMTLTVSVTAPDGRVLRNVSERPRSVAGVNYWVTNGIFGVVRGAQEGEVTAIHLASGAQETASLANGFFQLPAMAPLAGAFRLTFRHSDGRMVERIVTKDAADYYALLAADEPPVAAENLAPNPSFEETDLSGWDSYHGAKVWRTEPGNSGRYSLYVQCWMCTDEFGVNDHPNFVRSVPAAGAAYRFTATVYARTNLGGCRIRVREYLDGRRIGGSHYSNQSQNVPGWQELKLDYVAQRAGSSLDFQVVFEPGPEPPLPEGDRYAFWLDDVSIAALREGVVPAYPGVSLADAETEPGDPLREIPRFSASVTPNPLTTAGALRYTTTREGSVRLRVFDVHGRALGISVDRRAVAPGTYRVPLGRGAVADGPPLVSGVYWYRLESVEGVLTGKFVVLK